MSKLAWHFVHRLDDGTLQTTRNAITVRIGETLVENHRPRMCQRGLHACPDILELRSFFHYGNTLCRVELDGYMDRGGHSDKIAAQKRTILWAIDGDPVLALWAREMHAEILATAKADPRIVKFAQTGKGRKAARKAFRQWEAVAYGSADGTRRALSSAQHLLYWSGDIVTGREQASSAYDLYSKSIRFNGQWFSKTRWYFKKRALRERLIKMVEAAPRLENPREGPWVPTAGRTAFR